MNTKRLLLWLACAALIGCAVSGCKTPAAAEKRYIDVVSSITGEIETTMGEFNSAFGKIDPQNQAVLAEIMEKIEAVEKSCAKLRDLKAPKRYENIQNKYENGAQAYLDGFGSYKKVVSGLADRTIDQNTLNTELGNGNSAVAEGSKILTDLRKSMGLE